MVEQARRNGTRITADMYTYTAGATGLDASMPPWVQDGGLEKWIGRLKDPALRKKHKGSVNFAKADSFLDFGGIRIEDDIVIRDGAAENLTRVPKEIDAVEAACAV